MAWWASGAGHEVADFAGFSLAGGLTTEGVAVEDIKLERFLNSSGLKAFLESKLSDQFTKNLLAFRRA